MCSRTASRGRAAGTSAATADVDETRFGRRPPKAQAGDVEGFNLHASVVLGARDLEGRERLLRYVARPMVVGERVSELADGRIAWRLKVSGGRGETHRIMEPMEFMARLAALVPPPRFPLVRYHGVFAPNSPWRAVVVPGVSSAARGCEVGAARSAAIATSKHGALADVALAEPREVACSARRTAGRIDRATLMHRVWGWDVLACPRCEGRMKFIAVIKDRDVIARILTHVGLPAARVVAAPARRWDDTS